jgi:hypothetical protein
MRASAANSAEAARGDRRADLIAGANDARMRSMAVARAAACVLGVVVAACSGAAATDPAQMDPSSGECSEGLPTPICGKGTCSCCVGCGLGRELCFGDAWRFALGVGECTAQPTAGALTVTIGTTRFVADQVAAVVTDGYVQVSARGRGQTVALFLPGTLGGAACGFMSYAGSFAYFSGTAEYRNRPTDTRPACAVNLTNVGKVGERIEGTFSVMLSGASTDAQPVALTDGLFSIERTAFP